MLKEEPKMNYRLSAIKKIFVIRLSIVRSAVLCYLNPWSVRDSFNKENMLTHATHSYQTCTFEIKKKANNYPYKFFSWRWQRSQHACFFLVNFSYVWIFRSECLKPGGRGVVSGLSKIWPLGCTECAISHKGAKSLELTDVKPYVHTYFPYN